MSKAKWQPCHKIRNNTSLTHILVREKECLRDIIPIYRATLYRDGDRLGMHYWYTIWNHINQVAIPIAELAIINQGNMQFYEYLREDKL